MSRKEKRMEEEKFSCSSSLWSHVFHDFDPSSFHVHSINSRNSWQTHQLLLDAQVTSIPAEAANEGKNHGKNHEQLEKEKRASSFSAANGSWNKKAAVDAVVSSSTQQSSPREGAQQETTKNSLNQRKEVVTQGTQQEHPSPHPSSSSSSSSLFHDFVGDEGDDECQRRRIEDFVSHNRLHSPSSLMSHQTQPSTQSESKYQTLTPVPPLPVLSGTGHHTGLHPGQQYGHPPPPSHPGIYGFPPHPHQMPHQHPVFVPGAGHTYAPSYEPLPKHMKLEADSSSPSVENSFQVPSVSSTSTTRPGIPPPPGHPGHVLHPQQLHPLPPPSAQHPAQNHVQHQQQALHHHPQQQASHLRTTQVNHAVPQLPVVNSHQLPPHLIHGHPPPPPVSQNHQQQDQWTSDPSGQGSGSLSPGGDSNNGNEKSGKKKRKRCGECPGCLKKDNCGLCGPCKSVRSHQICKMRKCDQLKTKKEKAREVCLSFHFSPRHILVRE